MPIYYPIHLFYASTGCMGISQRKLLNPASISFQGQFIYLSGCLKSPLKAIGGRTRGLLRAPLQPLETRYPARVSTDNSQQVRIQLLCNTLLFGSRTPFAKLLNIVWWTYMATFNPVAVLPHIAWCWPLKRKDQLADSTNPNHHHSKSNSKDAVSLNSLIQTLSQNWIFIWTIIHFILFFNQSLLCKGDTNCS